MGGQVVHIVRSPAATERALFVYVTVGPRQGVFAVDSQSATDQPTTSAVAATASAPAASDGASGGGDMPRKKKWNVMRVSIKVRGEGAKTRNHEFTNLRIYELPIVSFLDF